MRTLYVQTFVLIFVILCLMFLQITNEANTPLYGVLLTISGPALAALLTNQALTSVSVNANYANRAIDAANNAANNTNNGNANNEKGV